ncbi:ATP-binding cassette domain-containing protein [Buttiauxella agrestis]
MITDAINDVGIAHLQHVSLGKLSGGERQRAGFARVLAQQPALLLLDEPTNHLDPLARHQLLSLIKHKNMTTVAVLHDLELIQPFSDRVLMMNQGNWCAAERLRKFWTHRGWSRFSACKVCTSHIR